MKPSMQIRPAQAADAAAVAALIQNLAGAFLSPDQPRPDDFSRLPFWSSLSESSILGHITQPEFQYWIGIVDSELVAVAALRHPQHVHHLFVASAYQGQGLASQLWAQLLAQGGHHPQGMTVNASLVAVPIYAHWGFITTSPPATKNGICFQAMHRPMSPPKTSDPAYQP